LLEIQQRSSAAPTNTTACALRNQPNQKSLEGTFVYLDRDKKLPIPLPAKLACTGNCQSANPNYRATLWGSGGKVVFGNLQLNSGFVG
jgi:hypothetical protein